MSSFWAGTVGYVVVPAIFEISIPNGPRTKFHASFLKCTTQAKIVTYPPHYNGRRKYVEFFSNTTRNWQKYNKKLAN